MEAYYLSLALNLTVIIIYGTICFIAAIFSFSLDTYLKIEEKLNFNISLLPATSNPIEQIEVGWINEWLVEHHKIAGLFLMLLSLLDLKLWIDIINSLSLLRL